MPITLPENLPAEETLVAERRRVLAHELPFSGRLRTEGVEQRDEGFLLGFRHGARDSSKLPPGPGRRTLRPGAP